MYCIGVRDGKRRQKLITALSRCIQNLKTLAIIGAENSVTKRFIGEKENGQIKGMISSSMLFLFLHNTTSHTKHLYQISKSSAQ